MSSAGSVPAEERMDAARGGKYLTFLLASEEYGVEILRVQEIIGLLPITRVARTPAFIRGVINLRGRVIPTVDLRLKFGMDAVEATEHTCIIVVQVAGLQMGVIVDRVVEVLDIAARDVEGAPVFGADVDTSYLLGIAKTSGQVRLLLDIDRVLSEPEIIDVQAFAAGQAESAA